jgi:hypothetical protein
MELGRMLYHMLICMTELCIVCLIILDQLFFDVVDYSFYDFHAFIYLDVSSNL